MKFHGQHYETLMSNGGFEGISAKPKVENGVYIMYLTEAEMKRFNANQEKINTASDDSISVALQASS